MKVVNIKVGVDEVTDKIVTALQIKGFKESIPSQLELLGLIENTFRLIKAKINNKLEILGYKEN